MRENVYSDYIIYADESGDHLLKEQYPQHPVFVLTFCIFSKDDYAKAIEELNKVKFKFWGHDLIVLHSHKIRKQTRDFSIFTNKDLREQFYAELNAAISNLPFRIIATAIDKRALQNQYSNPHNPYDLALTYCLERTQKFLLEHEQLNRQTHIILESRGDKEDSQLQSTYSDYVTKNYSVNEAYPCKLIFSDKRTNSIGLQLADLCAYPIGRYAVAPQQPNPAYQIIEEKFHRFPDHLGKGLKIFPYEASKYLIGSEKRKTPDFSEVIAD